MRDQTWVGNVKRLGLEDWTMGRKQTVLGNYEGEVWQSAEENSRVWIGYELEGVSCEPATGERCGEQRSLEGEAGMG